MVLNVPVKRALTYIIFIILFLLSPTADLTSFQVDKNLHPYTLNIRLHCQKLKNVNI